ncbi:hypothetical protein KYJ26_17620, partial [Bacillus sp. MCCB 382]|uniref:hypothetical protein n=1 Tax=Bacillus sp. MCCB 382 TaxID=2860197 RepID=UPI001C59D499|nr:hypothetical protein [Bacillus sp. MCCB 382]
EEAHRQPRGKRAPVAEINRHSLHPKATIFTKTAFKKETTLERWPSVVYLMNCLMRKGEIQHYEICEITNETVG